MIVQRFIRWCETANSRQRTEAFSALASSLTKGHIDPPDREGAGIALHLVVDDPSPKVRFAVAHELADSAEAPRSLIKTLLLDNEEIAARVARSPVLTAADLIETLKFASPDLQARIAARPCLPAVVGTELASSAHLFACRSLAANETAALTPGAFRRLARRFGDDAALRTAMLERDDIPADVRQTLILEVGRCFETAGFLLGVVGERHARRIAFEACERATSKIGEWVESRDIPDLVEHLRVTGQISPAFLIRAVCAGNIDLLAASLTALSGLSHRRVRAVVVDGRDGPFLSLARSCGLDGSTATFLCLAVRHWKDVATGAVPAGVTDVAEYVMQRVLAAFRLRNGGGLAEPASVLLCRLESEIARDSMRERLTQLMAA